LLKIARFVLGKKEGRKTHVGEKAYNERNAEKVGDKLVVASFSKS
jgi:hypothetical protein